MSVFRMEILVKRGVDQHTEASEKEGDAEPRLRFEETEGMIEGENDEHNDKNDSGSYGWHIFIVPFFFGHDVL
jgi:hypothetical protein